MLTTWAGWITLPDESRGPITDSTAPTPPPVQNGREPSAFSSWPIAKLGEHTGVSRLGLNPAVEGSAPGASLVGSAGVSTMLSGPRVVGPDASGSEPFPGADGLVWKYCGSGLPSLSVNDWPISLLPTGFPDTLTIEPSALACSPGSSETPQTTTGEAKPGAPASPRSGGS